MLIALQPPFTVLDRAALGFIAFLLILMCFGIYGLRQEIREAARIESEPQEGTDFATATGKRCLRDSIAKAAKMPNSAFSPPVPTPD